jgi:solute carrier family 50 protein (sugar transporter)
MEIFEYMGFIACFFTFAMYTSTIDQIKSILKTKTSVGVSYLFYLMMILNCFFWATYGYLINNYYILIPNSLGCALAITTLTIIYTYSIKSLKNMN